MTQRAAAHISRGIQENTSDGYIDAALYAKKKPRLKPMARKTSDAEDCGEDGDPKSVRRKPGPKPKKKVKGPKAVKPKICVLRPAESFSFLIWPKVQGDKVPSEERKPLPTIHFFWTRFELGNQI
ncbi:hypothetical protein DFH09DRAFT_1076424 [Mycena vulgaris]|nr:hypothetical protein DFH09DRAFT_1076424 [Mycena vulgaris]